MASAASASFSSPSAERSQRRAACCSGVGASGPEAAVEAARNCPATRERGTRERAAATQAPAAALQRIGQGRAAELVPGGRADARGRLQGACRRPLSLATLTWHPAIVAEQQRPPSQPPCIPIPSAGTRLGTVSSAARRAMPFA